MVERKRLSANKIMPKSTTKIHISDIILDNDIYPRERIDQKRVGIFAENIRDGFKFDPIEVQLHPLKQEKYRILDGAHRWSAYKATGITEVAEKYGWTEPMVWSIALKGKDDLERFKELNWGLRTWDLWNFNDCDKRFGDDWPGRIPAQLIAHILYYFTKQNDLVFDPMGGGGVTPDVCLAFNRRCWTLDMIDRPDTRPEIEPHYWDIKSNAWDNSELLNSKEKSDLIIFDPPYFDKKAEDYGEKSISMLSRKEYLKFFEVFFTLLKQYAKNSTKLAFINADWRNFQNKPANRETPEDSILIDDYLKILNKTGWQRTHVIQAPLSSERFEAGVVSAMQKKRIKGKRNTYQASIS